jgi:type II secretory pathway component PulF
MPRYKYQAINDTGKLLRGTLFALSAADVEDRLIQKGLTLVKSSPLKQSSLGGQLTGGKIKPRIIIEFYRRFSQTLDMGLPVLTGLDENAKSIPSKALKKTIEEVRGALEDGKTLYEAMKRFPKIFPKLDLAIVRIGEQSGTLPKCLKDMADFLEWKEGITSTIKRATIYPCFITVAITAVIGVWVGYVLPQMAGLLNEMGVDLPDVTRAVLKTSDFLRANWPWIIGLIVASIAGLYMFQKTQSGGKIFHKYLLKFPMIGTIISNVAFARLSHNFATMYSTGIKISDIFKMLKEGVLGNRHLEAQLDIVHQEVQLGQTLAEGFENAGDFPPLLLGAVRNGEATGTLDKSFKRLGDYYDSEVKRSVEVLVNAFEPMTIFLLGGVFGVILLSILLPLYDVIGDFGKAY